MKFKIEVERVDGDGRHWEEYDENIDDAQKWAEDIIEFFNGSCRPGETKRRLLAVEVLDLDSIKDDTWSKQHATTLTRPQG